MSRSVPYGNDTCTLWLRVNDPCHYDVAGGTYEAVVTKWLTENLKPGDTFFDIGANIGYYAVLAARLIGPEGIVIAVEADPNVAQILTKNFEANHLSNARVISGAVTDFSGTVRLGCAPASGWTGFYYRTADKWVEVPAFTVDSLVRSLRLTHVDVIKIDVEGAEGRVLDGMTDTFRRLEPKLLIEVHCGHSGIEEHVFRVLEIHRFNNEILDLADTTMHVAATPTLTSAGGRV
ncbi:MAG: FkbM family methyltransferase [Nitrososphaerales archaeon]